MPETRREHDTSHVAHRPTYGFAAYVVLTGAVGAVSALLYTSLKPEDMPDDARCLDGIDEGYGQDIKCPTSGQVVPRFDNADGGSYDGPSEMAIVLPILGILTVATILTCALIRRRSTSPA